LRIHEKLMSGMFVRVVRDYNPVQSISVDNTKVLEIVVTCCTTPSTPAIGGDPTRW